MGVFTQFAAWLRGDINDLSQPAENPGQSDEVGLHLRLLMIASAVGYLSAGLAGARWRTLVRGREVEGDLHYLLNVSPNQNQNKTEFCQQLVSQLALRNEALVVRRGNGLYVADSFAAEPHGFDRTWYTGITVEGDSGPALSLPAGEVMHLSMSWIGITPLLNQLAAEYEDTIHMALSGYQHATAEKGVLRIEGVQRGAAGQKQEQYLEKLMKSTLKSYFSSGSAALVLRDGYTYTSTNRQARNTSELNDVANVTDEWAERVAQALMVPATLLKCNAENTAHARSDLILYGIRPLATQIEAEYHRSYLWPSQYRRGDRLIIDTLPYELADAGTRATVGDKLIASGQMSPDEVRRASGLAAVGGPAAQLWMTKNYAPMEQFEEGNNA